MANIPIYGKLVNETPEGIIADAAQINAGGNKTQSEVNSDLSTAITNEVTARNNAIADETRAREDAIEAEQSSRLATDNELRTAINTEKTDRENAIAEESRLRGEAIQAEQTARTEADDNLSTAIEEEGNARRTADDYLEDLTCLSLVENREYVKAITDSEGRFLFGIRTNGSVEWAVGIPTPIKDELQGLVERLSSQLTLMTEELNQRINEVEDNTVLALEIDPANGDINLTYGSESSLVDAQIDPMTGDINFYYEL